MRGARAVGRQYPALAGRCDRRRASGRAQSVDAAAHERIAERRGHRIPDLSGRSAAALQRPPLRGRRNALPLDRRAARGRAGALQAICAQFRILRRAGRPVRVDRTLVRARRNGSTSAVMSRTSCCSRATTACTPARRKPGRHSRARSRPSSIARHDDAVLRHRARPRRRGRRDQFLASAARGIGGFASFSGFAD